MFIVKTCWDECAGDVSLCMDERSLGVNREELIRILRYAGTNLLQQPLLASSCSECRSCALHVASLVRIYTLNQQLYGDAGLLQPHGLTWRIGKQSGSLHNLEDLATSIFKSLMNVFTWWRIRLDILVSPQSRVTEVMLHNVRCTICISNGHIHRLSNSIQ